MPETVHEQNKLVAVSSQFDPDASQSGQWSASAYSDRLPLTELREIIEKHGGRGDSLDFVRMLHVSNAFDFVQDVCRMGWMGGHEGLIGYRIMRHTNVSNGYPLWSIEAHGSEPVLEEREEA